jgi:hypothetical protein
MLLKIDEQIRPALDRGQAKTTASPEWRSSILSKRAMVDLDWQPRRRLEYFSDEVKRHLSMFRQSLHDRRRKGWKPWIQAVRGGEQICLKNSLEFI